MSTREPKYKEDVIGRCYEREDRCLDKHFICKKTVAHNGRGAAGGLAWGGAWVPLLVAR